MTTLHIESDRRRRGFSLIELLIVIAIIMVIGTIATSSYQKAQMQTRETAVVQELGTIFAAQTQYYGTFGKYASNLSELGPPAGGAEGPQGASLIPKALADGVKNGYRFTMTGNGASFAVSAVPETFGSTGRRTFFMDQNRTVHQNWTSEPATANSPELK
jgi:type IV pilus assembly protein PilA